MGISGISPGSAPLQRTPVVQAKPASDGDSAAVEAAETSATKSAEQKNNGIGPKSVAPTTPGGVDKLV
jgi:hypothetical protein